MRCCLSAKGPCGLKFCPVKKGEPALGHPRQHTSVQGRDSREKAYFELHLVCEAVGCGLAATAVHHLTRRGLGGWNREHSELESLCSSHHEARHRGVIV